MFNPKLKFKYEKKRIIIYLRIGRGSVGYSCTSFVMERSIKTKNKKNDFKMR